MIQVKKSVSWQPAYYIAHKIIPAQLRDFLLDSGSTTRRMQKEYAAQTKVKLLKQTWQYPHYQEALLLKIPLRRYALIREVHLSSQNKLWMYARAVFPANLFTGQTKYLLRELDQRPLGKLLFRDPTMQRSEFELALLQPQHLQYEWALQQVNTSTLKNRLSSQTTHDQLAQAEQLWARRSIFWLHQKPFLLTEVFFPGFFELIKPEN